MKREKPSSVKLSDSGDALLLLDQTLLPGEEKYLHLTDVEEIVEAICSLRVRGAPAIGIAAAYALYLAVRLSRAENLEQAEETFRRAERLLADSRPTAVNLFRALERMRLRFEKERDSFRTTSGQEARSVGEAVKALREEADSIRDEDRVMCRSIGEYGLTLLREGMGILTHCNAGSIATAAYGTALAPIHLAAERNVKLTVYVTETRPLLQGARLTAWELQKAGVNTVLICDSAASAVLKQGRVQAVFVGCDRVAANGDTANKIGTSALAVLADHYGIPFYVASPTSTIDLDCPDGGSIPIEMRPQEEVTRRWYSRPMAPAGIEVFNPAFDVTDHELITAIITEKGIVYPPFSKNLKGQIS